MVIASRSLNVEVLLRKFARALLHVVPFNYKVSIVVLCQVQIVITDNQVIYSVRTRPNLNIITMKQHFVTHLVTVVLFLFSFVTYIFFVFRF